VDRADPGTTKLHRLEENLGALKPLGDAFIKLVKMIITPVIFLTVVTGIAGMRDLAAFGRVAPRRSPISSSSRRWR
jgi:aerobic C4-dicarboxylate transport protein